VKTPRPRTICLGVLLGLIGLTACSGPARTTAPGTMPGAFPNHSAEDIRTSIRRPADTLRTFAADARVTVRSPSRNRSFNADVRQQRADSLFMRFSLFGIEGGRMLMTPDSVFFYDTRKQTLRAGPIEQAQRLLPAPVASGEVFANMLGLIAPDAGTDWTVTADSSLYYLKDPTGQRQWTIDPSRWRVVRYTEKRADGTVLETRKFSNFRLVRGVVVPHRVVFQRPSEDLMARIQYENLRLNPSGLSFDLEAPSNLPRRSFGGR
jgi:hypothetical protein